MVGKKHHFLLGGTGRLLNMCNFSLALSETISLWKQNDFYGTNDVSFSKLV